MLIKGHRSSYCPNWWTTQPWLTCLFRPFLYVVTLCMYNFLEILQTRYWNFTIKLYFLHRVPQMPLQHFLTYHENTWLALWSGPKNCCNLADSHVFWICIIMVLLQKHLSSCYAKLEKHKMTISIKYIIKKSRPWTWNFF